MDNSFFEKALIQECTRDGQLSIALKALFLIYNPGMYVNDHPESGLSMLDAIEIGKSPIRLRMIASHALEAMELIMKLEKDFEPKTGNSEVCSSGS